MQEKFEHKIIIVREHFFKVIDMLEGNYGIFGIVLCLIRQLVGVFQIIPAAVINRNMSQRRQTLPEGSEKRLLLQYAAQAHAGINIKAAGIHLLHHFVNQRTAARTAPALKHDDNRSFGIAGHALRLSQALTQQFHLLVIIFFGHFFTQIQLFQHSPTSPYCLRESLNQRSS